MIIFAVFLILLACIFGWFVLSLHLTGEDRKVLGDVFYDHTRGFYSKHRDAFNRVTFDDHLKARFLLQDPWKLYPSDVAFAAKGVRFPHR